MIEYIKYAAKAVYAGAVALIAGVGIALLPDSAGVSDVTTIEKWTIAGAVLAAVGGVFGLTNGPNPKGYENHPVVDEEGNNAL